MIQKMNSQLKVMFLGSVKQKTVGVKMLTKVLASQLKQTVEMAAAAARIIQMNFLMRVTLMMIERSASHCHLVMYLRSQSKVLTS